jgi:hypothetical protein
MTKSAGKVAQRLHVHNLWEPSNGNEVASVISLIQQRVPSLILQLRYPLTGLPRWCPTQ